MPRLVTDLSGNIYGRLTVLKRTGSRHNKSLWLCQCRCGNTTEVISICLTRGAAAGNRVGGTKSCGYCRDKEKHPKEYQAWSDMLQRCTNPNHESYKYYGGRGISVCTRWSFEFLDFLEDLGKAESHHSLEREDNNGNYEPSNCKWANWSQQMQNRRFHNQFDH